MVNRCCRIANLRDGMRSVIKYGKQPNKKGPSGNGYSFLFGHQNGPVPSNWHVGDDTESLVVETIGSNDQRKLTWEMFDYNWRFHFYVSFDGGNFIRVGYVKIVRDGPEYNIWIGDNSIVIENDDQKLGMIGDGKSFKFYVVTAGGIEGTDDPGCLLNAHNNVVKHRI